MRNIYLAIILSAVSFLGCNKAKDNSATDDGKDKQGMENEDPNLGPITYNYTHKSLLLEFTSTGCPGCGSWGKPTFYSLVNDFKDKVVPIAAHIKYGDPMISGVAEFLASNRTGSRYTPQIWVNDKTIMVIANNSIDGSKSIQNAKDYISNAKTNEGYGLGSVLVVKNNKAYSKYGVSLKAEVPAGDYYIASYLMEDGIKANQAGVNPSLNPVTHNFVVRQAANATWGNKVTKEEGKPLTAEWEHTYTDDVNEGQYLVNIVWKKEGNIYRPLNIWK